MLTAHLQNESETAQGVSARDADRYNVLASVAASIAERVDDYEALVSRLAETVGSAFSGACVVRVATPEGRIISGSGWYPGDDAEAERLLHLASTTEAGPKTSYLTGLTRARWVEGAQTIAALCPPAYGPFVARVRPVGVSFISLTAHDQVVGLMAVVRTSDGGEGPQELISDSDLMELVARQVGLAIHNAMLLDAARTELRQRQKADAALKASEQRFRNAFRDSPAGMLLLDSAGRVIEINAAAAEIVDRDTILGTPFTSLVSAASSAAAVEALMSLRNRRGHRRDLELVFSGPGGDRIVGTTISAAGSKDGSYAYVVHAEDLTAERAAAEENRALHTRLVHQLEELTGARSALSRALTEVATLREAERRRLSVSLHENTVQTLMAATWALDDLRAQLGDSAEIANARALVEAAISSLRTISFALLPPSLSTVGLLAALDQQLDALADATGAEARLVATAAVPRFSADREALAFRVAADCLMAASGRQDLTEAVVEVSTDDEMLVLEVSMDGTVDPQDAVGLDAEGTWLATEGMVARAGGVVTRSDGSVRLELPMEAIPA